MTERTRIGKWQGLDVWKCRWCAFQGLTDQVEQHEAQKHATEFATVAAVEHVAAVTEEFTAVPAADKGEQS